MPVKSTFNLRRRWTVLGAAGVVTVALGAAVTWRPPTGDGCPFHVAGGKSPGGVAAMMLHPPAAALTEPAVGGRGTAVHARILGLPLGEAHRDDVEAWGAAHALRCWTERRSATVGCTTEQPQHVSTDFLGATELTVFFDLDDHDALQRVRTLARYPGPDAAVAALRRATDATALQAGDPYEVSGEPTPAYLAAGALRQARLHYARDNLLAQLSATNFGADYHVVQMMQLR